MFIVAHFSGICCDIETTNKFGTIEVINNKQKCNGQQIAKGFNCQILLEYLHL